jgi:hypothetical protein
LPDVQSDDSEHGEPFGRPPLAMHVCWELHLPERQLPSPRHGPPLGMCGSQTMTVLEDTSVRCAHWNVGHGCELLQRGKQPPVAPPSSYHRVPETQAKPLGQSLSLAHSALHSPPPCVCHNVVSKLAHTPPSLQSVSKKQGPPGGLDTRSVQPNCSHEHTTVVPFETCWQVTWSAVYGHARSCDPLQIIRHRNGAPGADGPTHAPAPLQSLSAVQPRLQ